MTDDNAGYVALAQAAIDREADVLGTDEAIERARDIDGLSVDETGTVLDVEGDGEAVLEALIDAYLAASGDIAAFMIARRFQNMPESDLSLPDNVAEFM